MREYLEYVEIKLMITRAQKMIGMEAFTLYMVYNITWRLDGDRLKDATVTLGQLCRNKANKDSRESW